MAYLYILMKEGKELLPNITDDIYSLLNYKDKDISIKLYIILNENNLSKLCKYILPTIPYEKSSKRFNYALQGYPNVTVTFLCDIEIEEDYKIVTMNIN